MDTLLEQMPLCEDGMLDLREMAREFMADPDFPNKLRAGHEGNVRRCLRARLRR